MSERRNDNLESQQSQQSQWQPCPPGLLTDQATRRSSGTGGSVKNPLVFGLVVGAIVSAAISSWAIHREFNSPMLAKETDNQTSVATILTCEQVSQAVAECQKHRLDLPTRRDVAAHLASCPQCREVVRHMQSDGLVPADAFEMAMRSRHTAFQLMLAHIAR